MLDTLIHNATLADGRTDMGVTGSHLTSMHSMDNYYVSKLLALMAEARLNVVANPQSTSRCRAVTIPTRSAAA